jgi:ribosomal protein S18 acetylase RimI-like enzyme
MSSGMTIRPYRGGDETAVIQLWEKCRLTRPQNNPRLDIRRKLAMNPELFLVGTIDGNIVATVMGGYEGHRGWINYLGVDPALRRNGLGRIMMEAVQAKLEAQGCPKINLQVRSDNVEVVKFYEAIGYLKDDVLSMGKRLVRE